MDIWSGLPPEQQQAITSGQELMTVLNKCETAEHWYLVGNALSTMQQAAMTYGNTNKPTGKSFNAAWASLAEQAPALKLMDKAERSNAIWLATEWHLVKPWLDTLTGTGQRELNHPRSIKRKYDAAHKVPQPNAEQVAEAIHAMTQHIAALKRKEQEAKDANNDVLAAHLAKKVADAEEELRNLARLRRQGRQAIADRLAGYHNQAARAAGHKGGHQEGTAQARTTNRGSGRPDRRELQAGDRAEAGEAADQEGRGSREVGSPRKGQVRKWGA